jgi:hypothetical protein
MGPAAQQTAQEGDYPTASLLSSLADVAEFAKHSGDTFAHWISPEGELVGDVRIVWETFREVYARAPEPLELELGRLIAEQTEALADPARLRATLEEYQDIISSPEAQALATTGILGVLTREEIALILAHGKEGLRRIQRKRQYYGAVLEGIWKAARDRLRFSLEGGEQLILREEDIPDVFAPEITRLSPASREQFISGLRAVFRDEALPLARREGAEVSKRFLFALYLRSIAPPQHDRINLEGALPQGQEQEPNDR